MSRQLVERDGLPKKKEVQRRTTVLQGVPGTSWEPLAQVKKASENQRESRGSGKNGKEREIVR